VPEVFAIPAALDGERVDRALSLITGLSRQQIAERLEAGDVTIAGRPVSARSRRVHEGEKVALEGPIAPDRRAPLSADPAVEVRVVWFDDELIVVDKPAGLVVHPGAGNRSGTLVHGLLARFPDLQELATGDDEDRPGIVHRLDKGTSGLLVVARNPRSKAHLVRQLSDREMVRRYVALVHGTMEADAGLIDAPLGRSDLDPTRMRVQAGARQARTRYEVRERYTEPESATLLDCRLETGRTHQIRVHLASIGHPVVGDDRYGSRRSGRRLTLPAGRPFLHAAALSLKHPVTGEVLSFETPLPEDLTTVLDGMKP
jgi:23S rRNA pseudouridine1911/1915/1917 synthase